MDENKMVLVRMGYAIHKSLPYNAKDVYRSIEDMTGELPGSTSSTWSDGWVIVDQEGVNVREWGRNKEDYRIEYLCFDSEDNVFDEEEVKRLEENHILLYGGVPIL